MRSGGSERQRRLRPAAIRVVRTTVVAATCWVVAEALGARQPVYATLVPVLAIQDDPFGVLNVSLSRLVGVVSGVAIGLAVLSVLGPSTASVALVIAAGLTLGSFMGAKGATNNQVAISGLMVVIESTHAASYGWMRLWETGVGALVSIALAPILWPPDPAHALNVELRRLAADLRKVLVRVTGDLLASDEERDAAAGETVRLQRRIAQAMEDADRAQRRLRFNLWRRRGWAGLDAEGRRAALLGGCALDCGRLIEDVTAFAARNELEGQKQNFDPELRRLGALVGAALAEAFDASDDGHPALVEAQEQIVRSRRVLRCPVAAVLRRSLAHTVERLESAAGADSSVDVAFGLLPATAVPQSPAHVTASVDGEISPHRGRASSDRHRAASSRSPRPPRPTETR